MNHARWSLAILCVAGASALAQQSPVIRTESRTVLVDAVVTGKRGEYIRDLSARDFRIWEDGKEQAVASVAAEAKAGEPHFLVLFFDDNGLGTDQFIARQAVGRFIDANAAPNLQMAVVSYNGSLRIAQNFTDNTGRLKDALSRSEAAVPGASATVDTFAERNMLQALEHLVAELGVLPGRKTVVALTAGVPFSADMKASITAVIQAASKSGVAVYPVNVQPVPVDVDFTQPAQVGRGNRGRGGAGGVEDAASPAQDPSGENQQLLLALANGTGGFLVRDSSELLAGLQRIGDDQTQSYVLSYTPPDAKEGSCHTLRVKVERAAATVRARSSYCTGKPQDLIAATEPAKNLENRAAGAAAGTLKASLQLPYFYTSPGVATVHLAMEIAPEALKVEPQSGGNQKLHAEINLLGIATAPDGSVGARFSDTLKLDFDSPAEFEKSKNKPVHYEKQFKIAPGSYNFAVAFGSGEASFGKLESPLAIEPWNNNELAISGVALSRETHSAADLGLLSSLVEDRTPLAAQGVQFVPFGSNQFAKSDMGYFYVEIYDPDPDSVRARVQVVDRKSGELKWDSGATKLPRPDGARAWISAAASLRLSSLAAGSYRLRVTASDSAGKEVLRESDFEVSDSQTGR